MFIYTNLIERCEMLFIRILFKLKNIYLYSKPEEFGVGFLSLKTVLLSNTLSLASLIEVNDKKVKSDPASLSWQLLTAEGCHSNITGKLEVGIIFLHYSL